MTRAPIAVTVLAVVAIAVAAASLTTPVPGSAVPDPLRNRTMPDQGGIGDAPIEDRDDRPTITLPGVSVSLPVAFDLPPWLGAGLVLALLAGMVVAVIRELRDRPATTTIDPVTPDEVTDDPTPEHGIGDAAGRAADRLLADADAAVTNEVYRAWQEMTTHLPVADPGSSTPREFADAAVDAGLDPDDVETLTTLFERVRYGDERVTDDDTDTVAAVLKEIESTYADDATPDTRDSDRGDDDAGTIPDPWEDDP